MRNGEIVEVTVHEIKAAQTVLAIVGFFLLFLLNLMFSRTQVVLPTNWVDAIFFFIYFFKFIEF